MWYNMLMMTCDQIYALQKNLFIERKKKKNSLSHSLSLSFAIKINNTAGIGKFFFLLEKYLCKKNFDKKIMSASKSKRIRT